MAHRPWLRGASRRMASQRRRPWVGYRFQLFDRSAGRRISNGPVGWACCWGRWRTSELPRTNDCWAWQPWWWRRIGGMMRSWFGFSEEKLLAIGGSGQSWFGIRVTVNDDGNETRDSWECKLVYKTLLDPPPSGCFQTLRLLCWWGDFWAPPGGSTSHFDVRVKL